MFYFFQHTFTFFVAAEREEYASIYWQPETAQTENEYEQIEVSVAYVRLFPARLSLYLYINYFKYIARDSSKREWI
jgi:hypothetical protein